YGPKQRRARRGKNYPANEPGGRRRDRAPASLAQYRWPDHSRFHRHEEPQRPAGSLRLDEGAAQSRQGQDTYSPNFTARPDGDDPPTSAGKLERHDLRKLSLLQRARRRQDFHDHERGIASDSQYRHAQISGYHSCYSG